MIDLGASDQMMGNKGI